MLTVVGCGSDIAFGLLCAYVRWIGNNRHWSRDNIIVSEMLATTLVCGLWLPRMVAMVIVSNEDVAGSVGRMLWRLSGPVLSRDR